MSPFDSEDEVFFVLKNKVGQFSVWPTSVVVPEGWQVVASGQPLIGAISLVDNLWVEGTAQSPTGVRSVPAD